MENINSYIGIPHKFNGRTRDGCDCLGLCYLFYRGHNWKQTWDDGKPITHDWKEKDPMRLTRYLSSNFKLTRDPNDLDFGDIILFNIAGDVHFGIYLEYGKCLAMQVPCVEGQTTSTIYHRDIWQLGFKAGYKR